MVSQEHKPGIRVADLAQKDGWIAWCRRVDPENNEE